MEIKRESWWYKVYDFNTSFLLTEWINYHKPENLCHFRRVVLFWVPLKIALCLSLLWVALVELSEFYIWWPNIYWTTVTLAMVWPVGLYIEQSRIRPWSFWHPSFLSLGHPAVSPKVSLFIEWIKAKKQRICPFIEF